MIFILQHVPVLRGGVAMVSVFSCTNVVMEASSAQMAVMNLTAVSMHVMPVRMVHVLQIRSLEIFFT